MSKDMAEAPGTIEVPVGAIRVNEVIRVTKRAARQMVGSCNACTPSIEEPYSTVTNIDLRGMSFRLCDSCKKTLKSLL